MEASISADPGGFCLLLSFCKPLRLRIMIIMTEMLGKRGTRRIVMGLMILQEKMRGNRPGGVWMGYFIV